MSDAIRSVKECAVCGRVVLCRHTGARWLCNPCFVALMPPCCNPDHLEEVTQAENMRRSSTATKTHCVHGHALIPDNLYAISTRPGIRVCKACHKRRTNERRRPSRRHTGTCSQCGGPCMPTAKRCQYCVRWSA